MPVDRTPPAAASAFAAAHAAADGGVARAPVVVVVESAAVAAAVAADNLDLSLQRQAGVPSSGLLTLLLAMNCSARSLA